MKNLENLIIQYQTSGSEEIFEVIYAEVTQATIGMKDGNPYFRKVASSLNADVHAVKAAFDDTLLNALRLYTKGNDFIKYFSSSWRRRRADVYQKAKRINTREAGDHETTLLLIQSDEPQELPTKKKADQLALIDSLLNGADATTTAIVEAFLNHPKPTATAIAKELGVHHSKVIRALNRLAGKFSTKQHGDYHDYLVAL